MIEHHHICTYMYVWHASIIYLYKFTWFINTISYKSNEKCYGIKEKKIKLFWKKHGLKFNFYFVAIILGII